MFQLPMPILCVVGFMHTCLVSLLTLFVMGAICSSFACARRDVCAAQVYMPPPVGTPVPPFAPAVCRRHTRLPGPALCAARVVCAGWVCTPCHSRFPEPPPVWGHSLGAVNGRRSAALPVYCPPSPCCAWFFKTAQRPLRPACEGVSLCSGTPVSGLSPSLGAQVPAQKFSIFSLFMSPSFLLPHFRELKLFPWRPGVCCCHLEFAL